MRHFNNLPTTIMVDRAATCSPPSLLQAQSKVPRAQAAESDHPDFAGWDVDAMNQELRQQRGAKPSLILVDRFSGEILSVMRRQKTSPGFHRGRYLKLPGGPYPDANSEECFSRETENGESTPSR